MKLALLGYGRMGKAIESTAISRGHTIAAIVDPKGQKGALEAADVAINFSVPNAAVDNIKSALACPIPVVCGTTGWLDQMKTVEAFCLEKNSAFLYASNFSVGVNLFFALNKKLASLMRHHPEYDVAIEETHHVHKLDAPSGTAISLAQDIINQTDYQSWVTEKNPTNSAQIPIHAIRKGEVPGTHNVYYQSEIDKLSIRHQAHNRKGFALGAVLAAEWILGKKGIFSMADVLNLSENA